MVSRVLGVVRSAMLVACIGGQTGTATAFQTANVLPNTIFILLSGGLLTSILIPQITKAMNRGKAGQEAIDALLTFSFLVCFVVALASTLLAGPLISVLQLQGSVRDLGILFAYICLPQIFFYGAYVIWGQVLNACGRFGEYMWTPVLANIIQIAGMAIFLHEYSQVTSAERWSWPMFMLLAGTSTLGIMVQALGLIPALIAAKVTWRFSLKLRGHGFRSAAKVAAWTIVAVSVAQIGGFITQQAINHASEQARLRGESVANINIYTLSYTVFMVPIGVIAVSILTALFPQMSRAVQSGDQADTSDLTIRGLRLPAVIMVPITFAALVLATPGMGVLNPFMTGEEIASMAMVFSIMALGMVPYAISTWQQRFSMAREDGSTNLRFQAIITGVQMGVAVLVVVCVPARFAVAAVAAGQTLGNGLAAVLFVTMVHRLYPGSWLSEFGSMIVRLVVTSLPAAGVAWLTVRGVAAMNITTSPYAVYLAELGGGAVVFIVVFVLCARWAHVEELDRFLAKLPLARR